MLHRLLWKSSEANVRTVGRDVAYSLNRDHSPHKVYQLQALWPGVGTTDVKVPRLDNGPRKTFLRFAGCLALRIFALVYDPQLVPKPGVFDRLRHSQSPKDKSY